MPRPFGMPLTPEHKANISKGNLGKHHGLYGTANVMHRPEISSLIRILGYWNWKAIASRERKALKPPYHRRHSVETKLKISLAQKGKPETEETKRKVSEGVIKAWKDGKKFGFHSDNHYSVWSPESYSWLEKKFEKLLKECRLKGYEHNHLIVTQGKHYYFADFAFPDLYLAIEVDSVEFHSSDEQKARDAIRQERLENAGWKVVRFQSKDVLKRPAWVKAELKKAVGEMAQHTLSEGFPLG